MRQWDPDRASLQGGEDYPAWRRQMPWQSSYLDRTWHVRTPVARCHRFCGWRRSAGVLHLLSPGDRTVVSTFSLMVSMRACAMSWRAPFLAMLRRERNATVPRAGHQIGPLSPQAIGLWDGACLEPISRAKVYRV
jgi:hypothetical protein